MQIFSNNHGARGANAPRELPQIKGLDAARQPASTRPSAAIARRDSIDLSGAEKGVGGPDAGMTPRERLDAFAAKYLERLDNLMQQEGLSREQVTALQQAKDAFQQNVDRFASRFLGGGGSREGMGGAIGQLVGALRSDVQDALGQIGDGGDWLGRGDQG